MNLRLPHPKNEEFVRLLIRKRKGLMGKVQRFGKKHQSLFIQKNPELASAGALIAIGLLGAELLD